MAADDNILRCEEVFKRGRDGENDDEVEELKSNKKKAKTAFTSHIDSFFRALAHSYAHSYRLDIHKAAITNINVTAVVDIVIDYLIDCNRCFLTKSHTIDVKSNNSDETITLWCQCKRESCMVHRGCIECEDCKEGKCHGWKLSFDDYKVPEACAGCPICFQWCNKCNCVFYHCKCETNGCNGCKSSQLAKINIRNGVHVDRCEYCRTCSQYCCDCHFCEECGDKLTDDDEGEDYCAACIDDKEAGEYGVDDDDDD